MLMLTIMIFALGLFAPHYNARVASAASCLPIQPSKEFWIKKYEMVPISPLVPFWEKRLIEKKDKDTQNLRMFSALGMSDPSMQHRWGRLNNSLVLISYVRGDAVMVHKIHAYTGEYSVVELSYNTNQFFESITGDHFFVISAREQDGKDQILEMYTSITLRNEKRNRLFPGFKHMTRLFPQLAADVIKKFAPVGSETISY